MGFVDGIRKCTVSIYCTFTVNEAESVEKCSRKCGENIHW